MKNVLEVIEFLKANNFQWENWKLSATVTLTDVNKTIMSNYDDCERYDDIFITFRGSDSNTVDIADCDIGSKIDVTIELPRTDTLFVAKDVNDFVTQRSLLSKSPDYIIYSEDFVSSRDSITDNDVVYGYEKVRSFIQLCLEYDVLELHHSVNKLVLYFSNSKLVIPCELNARSITREVGGNFNSIITKFNQDKHKSDRVHMLRSTLHKILNNCAESKRIIHLTSKSGEFVTLFEQNYDLFMSQFCFSSEKDKIFEAKREFLSKLSQLLSGIQAKLLAIPISLVLILGQMKSKPEENPLLVNSLILAASVVFTTIMIVLLCSQLTAITAIKEEVKSKRTRFELELADLFNEVRIAFDSVITQCNLNKAFIWLMFVVVVLGFISTIITYVILTPEIKVNYQVLYDLVISKFGWMVNVSTWSSTVVKI
ncbi:hypothetical protein AB4158_02040 [Vibrio splendidus]